MLDVSEKTVQKWKLRMVKQEVKEEILQPEVCLGDAKEEYIIEYLD
jgi:hypothetical protein